MFGADFAQAVSGRSVKVALALGCIGVSQLANGAAPDADAGAADAGGEIFLPGTQPRELTKDFRSPDLCTTCHGGYAEYAATDTWQGTMMANAARDPLFHAALTVANQDIPGSGDLCIRCHSPRAWLFGRSNPPLVSNFEKEDFQGVDCDFCHRLTPSPEGEFLVGTGQFFVADDFVRRGPIENPRAPHESKYEPYFSESRLCAVCHDVSNPLKGGFAIERTYSEWLASAFPEQGKSCQSCHMPEQEGTASGARGMPTRKVHRHELAGGNYWMPKVLAAEFPELGRQKAYERTALNAQKMLRDSATLAIVNAPENAAPGSVVSFVVRVENKAGHKLPTGYPEGRRCWLEVKVTTQDGAVLFHSGAYDSNSATRAEDPALRTYEVRMAAGGKEGFHFILQDELLQDSRIPPRGFIPAPDTTPVGRNYPVVSQSAKGPVLAHWDEAPYSFSIPEADTSVPGVVRISATLLYQTTSREYIEALRDANVTDESGNRLHALWTQHGQAPPFAMAETAFDVEIQGDTLEDAGARDGAADADSSVPVTEALGNAADARVSGGCTCNSAVRPSPLTSGANWAMTLIGALGIFRGFRTRRKPKCVLGPD